MVSYNINYKAGTLDIGKTLDCGQCFRWKKYDTDEYIGVINGEFVLIQDSGNGKLEISTSGITKEYLINYLGLNDDYSELDKVELDDFANKAKNFSRGIRILHQEPWEATVSFIISQRNNIPKIKTSIERLCTKLGDCKPITFKCRNLYFYTFPTPEQIVNGGISALNECGLGYRSEYVMLIAKQYLNNPNLFDTCKTADSGEDVVDYLLQFKGIGPKVANCIALFGFNKLDMFPIDVWIQRVIDTYYKGNIDISRYGKLAGLIQQYMFYYIKNK